ncbi:DUF3888 domain-containing protein [Schinkia azotoformans]|uniref:DUF3888 domain-containing protein n=1 Tax=Schinkia azotoformans TaxID=1454 RepID=UPI002E1D57C8|nr:DUF3888 domain-containing protein [Schinkia azotoformans]
MQKIMVCLVIILGLSFTPTYIATANTLHSNTTQSKCKINDDLILSLFTPKINAAVEQYYNERRQYWREKIINIKEIGNYKYEVTIQIETFVGAHDAPVGKDTLVFTTNLNDIKLKKYTHQLKKT